MNRTVTSPNPKLSSPWVYFVVTLAWTWFFWLLASLLGLGMDTASGVVLLLLGVLGPMVTGITFTYLTYDRAGRRDYWRRIIDFKRISGRWYLVIFLFAPILNILAALPGPWFAGVLVVYDRHHSLEFLLYLDLQ